MTQTSRDKMVKDIIKKNKFLTKKSNFNFKCNACGRCCYNQEIILNTYDILRLRREFEKPTVIVLNKYCEVYPGPNSKMPVCLLKFIKVPNTNIDICPFLKPEFYKEIDEIIEVCNSREEIQEKAAKIIQRNMEGGKTKKICSIHKNSPEVCKLYPLGRGLIFDKKTKKAKTKYFN